MGGSNARGAIFLICGMLPSSMGSEGALAATPVARSKGQTVYAAAYSYVLMGAGKQQFPVTATVVIRNTDLVNTIIVTTVDYRDSKGEHLRHHVEEPIVVNPLASIEFFVKDSDATGGHSPSFIVRWEANKTVNAPVVEVLIIGGHSSQGLSFIGRAWALEEAGDSQDERERGISAD